MKRIYYLPFFLLLMMAIPAFARQASKSDVKTVKVGFFEAEGMYNGADDGKKKSGYCFDYLMHIASYTGWNYDFCYGTFAQLYDKLKRGEIDILPYTNKNSQREKDVLFSDFVMAEEEYYIVADSKHPAVNGGIDKLNGSVISTVTGYDSNSLLADFLKKNNLNVKLKYYSSIGAAWEAMRQGKVNATIYTSNSYSKDGWSNISSFGRKPTYISVSKSRPDIMEELNFTTNLINEHSPSLTKNLYKKYFNDNPIRKILTADELEWVKNHPVLHVGCFPDDAPYIVTYDNEKKTATGLTVDIVNGVIERLNLDMKADFKCYKSVAEMEKALDKGEIDVFAPFYPEYDVAFQHKLILSTLIRMSNMELVYKNGTSMHDALTQVATPVTKLGIYYVHDNYPNAEIVDAQNIQDAVNHVLKGDAKGAIAQNYAIHAIKEKYDNLNSVVLPTGCGTCFAARLDDYLLIRILNRGLLYFSSAEILSIASKHRPEPTISTKAFINAHKDTVVIMAIFVIAFLVFSLIMLNRLKNKADEANLSKSKFLFNMSHDIRTPMNAITGFTAMAKKNAGNKDKVMGYLDKIDISGQHLLKLINQVLEMSRIESGKIEFVEIPVNVKERYEALISFLSEQAEVRGLVFNHSLRDIKHYNIFADDARMSQITMNIAGNAIKYTPEGGRIDFILREVPARKEGCASYTFTVADTGIGMSEEFMNTLFEPFAREKTSTVSRIQGTGLGLAIVKSLVDLAGGEIKVESEVGKGTRFDITIDFRIDEESSAQSQETNNEDSESETKSVNLKGKRILLVEDNELNREIAKSLLEDQGLIVEEAEDGDIAVEKVKSALSKGEDNPFDAILMDIQMPRMNGYEATRQIRDFERSCATYVGNAENAGNVGNSFAVDRGPLTVDVGRHIPIIAVSANAFEEDKLKSCEVGMDAHVAKPIDVTELVMTLKKFLK